MGILDWFRLEIVIALGAFVSLLVKLFRMLPADWTSSKPKMWVFIIATFVVGGIGYYEGADIGTISSVIIGVGISAIGLYEIAKSTFAQLK